MPDDRAAPPDYLGLARDYDPASKEFAELRELLLGAERRQLAQLQRRVEKQQSPEGLADQLPEAIALRSGRDRQLARALAPTIDDAITESVRQNPREIATAIFPVLGPAIRKALAEAMAALVESINRAVEHTFSLRGLKWRIEAWRTGTPYAQIVIKHALVYRVEQVFLIHAETGLLLAHAAPPELRVTDADLISGMLTAIQDFVGDSFQQQEDGKLRTFSVGELTVIVEAGPQALLAAVVRGQPPEPLRLKLQERLETVHFQFAAAFADFSGNAAPFAPAQALLEECLETVLRHHRTRAARGRLVWLRWAVPLVLLAAAVGWLALSRQRRWSDAVARLRAEPGIEIVEATRSGGTWHFRGLKDPLAAEPAVILAGLGADTARLDARWKPFVSLEPSLVTARARQALSAPASVKFRLSGDTLYAAGAATLAWVSRASALPMLPPGISVLSLAAVAANLSPELAALKSQVETSLILFDIGSAAIGSVRRGALDSVGTAFLRLSAATGRLGYRADLELLGRADTTGTEETNQNLSRARIDAVGARLVGLGVRPEAWSGVPLGVSRPLPGRDGIDEAQANRSVAFVVRVRREASGPEGPR